MLSKWIESSKASLKQIKHYEEICVFFTKWLEKYRPDVLFWDQLRSQVLKDYSQYLVSDQRLRDYPIPKKRKGKGRGQRGFSGVKSKSCWGKYIAPIRNASRLAADDSERYRPFGMTLKPPDSLVSHHRNRGTVILDFSQVLNFIDFLLNHSDGRKVIVPVAIAGLLGSRLSEPCRLDLNDFDHRGNTIYFPATNKNPFGERRLPVPRIIMAILESMPASGPATPWSEGYVAKQIKNLLLRYDPQLQGIVAKNLRKTLPAYQHLGSLDPLLVEHFIGHVGDVAQIRARLERSAPSRVTAKHYMKNDIEFLYGRFVNEIHPFIEEQIESWNGRRIVEGKPSIYEEIKGKAEENN